MSKTEASVAASGAPRFSGVRLVHERPALFQDEFVRQGIGRKVVHLGMGGGAHGSQKVLKAVDAATRRVAFRRLWAGGSVHEQREGA